MPDAKLEARFKMWTEHGGRVRLEPTPKRVRVVLGGAVVADSTRVQMLYLPPPDNGYMFPKEDVRWELLKATEVTGSTPGLGEVARWTVVAGSKVAEAAAWTVAQPPAELEPLAELVGFRWNSMDSWYEEDDEVFVHPRDPYHRVDVLNSSRHVKVTVAGEVIAETRRPRLLFETGLPVRYYIPKMDVRLDLLEPSDTTTRCPYKGVASYWSVRAGGSLRPDLGWTYELPIPECPKIENLVCFFNERVDIDVDGERIPRPRTPWSEADG